MRQLQAVIDGGMTGSLYALVALAFSLVWATMRTVNLAFLQLIAFAAIIGWASADFGAAPAIIFAVLATAGLTLVTHLVAVQPMLKKARMAPIVASIGAGLLLQGILSDIAGSQLRIMPNLFPTGVFEINGIFIRKTGIAVVAVVLVFVAITLVIFRYTMIGLAFRATSWAPELGSAYGVATPLVQLGSVVAAGLAIGLSGVLTAVLVGSVSPFIGANAGLKGVIAMLVGGAGNMTGAVAGGLLIGILESVAELYVSSAMKTAVSFGLLLVVMIVRPSGLLKER
ncbi:MAG: branched-chain amino acid ABC transporter permease [Acidimicrobiales bacterium]